MPIRRWLVGEKHADMQRAQARVPVLLEFFGSLL